MNEAVHQGVDAFSIMPFHDTTVIVLTVTACVLASLIFTAVIVRMVR